jgi:FKBP-type peptidyl-prolyl cis-trans isomerase FklB
MIGHWSRTTHAFAGIGLRWDNSGMLKSMTIVVNTLAAGTLLLGHALAQQTPAATTQTAPPPAKTPATKRPSTAAKAGAPLALKTQKEKFSYAVGMNTGQRMAESFKKQSVPYDPAIIARGLKDGLAGSKTLLTDDEARAAIKAVQEEVGKAQQAKLQEEGAVNKKQGDAFLAANKGKEGVVTLPSGLQYKIIKAGSGPKPTVNDTVVCNYKGTLIDGKEFDSSYKRGQPATFPVGGVIKGWTEALQLMPVGSKWQLFIPSDLAYGDRGAGADIGPDSTLVFEVELMSIEAKGADKGAEKPGDQK